MYLKFFFTFLLDQKSNQRIKAKLLPSLSSTNIENLNKVVVAMQQNVNALVNFLLFVEFTPALTPSFAAACARFFCEKMKRFYADGGTGKKGIVG